MITIPGYLQQALEVVDTNKRKLESNRTNYKVVRWVMEVKR